MSMTKFSREWAVALPMLRRKTGIRVSQYSPRTGIASDAAVLRGDGCHKFSAFGDRLASKSFYRLRLCDFAHDWRQSSRNHFNVCNRDGSNSLEGVLQSSCFVS